MREAGNALTDRSYELGEDVPLIELAEAEGVEVEARDGEVVVYGESESESPTYLQEIDQV